MATEDIGGPVDLDDTAQRVYDAAMKPLREGNPLRALADFPPWDDLPEDVRDLWRRAADAGYREGFDAAY